MVWTLTLNLTIILMIPSAPRVVQRREETKRILKDSSPINLITESVGVIEEKSLASTPIEELVKIINKPAENFAMNAISIGICLKLARSRIAKSKQN